MIYQKIFTFVFTVTMIFISSTVFAFAPLDFNRGDDPPYNRMVIISGTVTITNHPELGVTPFNNVYLVFQREDCKRCLVGTFTDIDGKYKIYVGEGRYKVFLSNPSPPVVDLLSSDQPRFINAKNRLEENVFDIKVTFPKDYLK
jgi:hypothetical protein